MKNRRPVLPYLFSIVMILFVLFIVWYLPSVGALRFRLDDISKSIETSRGRERKQQVEYDETVSAIPEIQARIDSIMPLTEAAEQEVRDLKTQRKKLRNEKKELESQQDMSGTEEANDHE